MPCNALCYYLDHIHTDIKHGRMDYLRTNADHVCALLNGYYNPIKGNPVKGGFVKGDHEKYKLSCFASQSALAILQNPNQWNSKNIKKRGLHLEHVIPISTIGNIFLTHNIGINNPQDILPLLNRMLIPCVITDNEDAALNKNKFRKNMPTNWIKAWDRYRQTMVNSNGQNVSLFSQIVALRINLQNSAEIPLAPNETLPDIYHPKPSFLPCNCTGQIEPTPPNTSEFSREELEELLRKNQRQQLS